MTAALTGFPGFSYSIQKTDSKMCFTIRCCLFSPPRDSLKNNASLLFFSMSVSLSCLLLYTQTEKKSNTFFSLLLSFENRSIPTAHITFFKKDFSLQKVNRTVRYPQPKVRCSSFIGGDCLFLNNLFHDNTKKLRDLP